MQDEILAIFAELLKKYPPILTLAEGAEILRIPSVNALRIRFNRKKLPVRIRENGGEQCIFLTDIAEWQATGQKQEQILPVRPKAPKNTAKSKGGRPSKAEEIAKRQVEQAGG